MTSNAQQHMLTVLRSAREARAVLDKPTEVTVQPAGWRGTKYLHPETIRYEAPDAPQMRETLDQVLALLAPYDHED